MHIPSAPSLSPKSILIATILFFLNIPLLYTQSISLTLSSTTINTNSIYNFEIFDSNLITRDGTMTIQFSAAYFTITSGSLSIYDTTNPTKKYTYTILNNNKVVVNYVRGTQVSPIVKLSMASIRNPLSTVSVSFVYRFASGGVQYSSTIKSVSPYTPAALQSCSITFNPSITHTQSTMSVSISLKTATPAGSTIQITFPSFWQNSYSISAYKPVASTSINCAWIESKSYLSSSPSCNKFSDEQIYIDSCFTTAVSSGSTVKFTMATILTPATNSPNNFVTISTTNSNGATVDSSSCAVTIVTPQTLALSSTSTFVLGQANQPIKLSWITYSPIIINDTISISLPQNYLEFGTVTSLFSSNNGTLLKSSISPTSNLTYQLKISAINNSASATYYIAPLKTIEINFYIKCLIDTSSRNIVVSISRNGYKIAEGVLGVTPGPNLLSSSSLSSSIQTVSSLSVFTFEFTLSNPIPTAAGTIEIQAPASIQLSGAQPTCTISSSTNSQALTGSLSCSISTRNIKISSFLSASLPISAKLSISVSNSLINPLTTEPTSTFLIRTISVNNYTIDQNTQLTYTASQATISSFTITPSSFIVGADTLYTFVYTLNKKIPVGSKISITLPPSISTLTSTIYTYFIDSGSFFSIVPTLTLQNSKNVLIFANFITTDLLSGKKITIRADKLHNPESMKPTQSFIVKVTSSTGYAIESVSSGKIITMQTLASFSELTPILATTQKINGASADYTFYFRTPVSLQTGYSLILEITDSPAENAISFATTINVCSIKTSSNTLTNTCQLSNNQLTIILSGNVDASSTYQYKLVISEIVLARTMDTTSKFRLTGYNALYGVIQSSVNALTNTLANKLQQFSLNILTTPSQLNQIQQFSLSLNLFNKIFFANGQYLILELPVSYIFIGNQSDTNLCTNTDLTCKIFNSNNFNAIKITSTVIATSISSLTFTMKNSTYVSPKNFGYQTDYFYLTSYSASNKKIDETSPEDTPVVFKPTCHDYCKTCRATDLSYCLTCYSLGQGYDPLATYSQYIYKTSDNQCVNECGNGYYNNSGICTRCTSPCATCSLSGTNCLTCIDTFYYNRNIDQCVLECPEKTYENDVTNTCETCSTSCYNCTNNSVTCTSCNTGKFLLNSICNAECGFGYYEDFGTGTCKVCSAGCNGCLDHGYDCISCKSGYYFQSAISTTCVSSCPSGSVKNTVSGICQCGGSCATCAGTLTNCTSCPQNLIFYDSSCLSECPANTYLSGSFCQKCKDSNCLQCTANICLQCSTGYLLYNGVCSQSCPAGTYKTPNDYTCSLCQYGCKQCLTSTFCLTCYDRFLIEGSTCVNSCSANFINFNATMCVAQCPTGYKNQSSRCVEIPDDSNNTDNTNNTNNTTDPDPEQNPTFVPIPFTLSYIVTTSIVIGMKCLFAPTLLPVAIMSFGSILEVFSVGTLVAVGFTEQNQQILTNITRNYYLPPQRLLAETSQLSLQTPLTILVASLIVLLILNISNVIFISKYLQEDPKFRKHYRRAKKGFIFVRVLATITNFKFHEIIFSNVMGCKMFKAKVEFVSRLIVFNIWLVFSFVWSVLVLIGAGIISYQKQNQLLFSPSFMQSIDCVLVIILNIIPTVLVIKRKEKDYCEEIKDQGTRYETNEEFQFEQSGEAIDQVYVEGNDRKRLERSRRDYFYKNNRTTNQFQENEVEEGPLSKRLAKGERPIKEKLGYNEQSSTALVMKEKNQQQQQQEQKVDDSDDLEEINFDEPVRAKILASPHKKNDQNQKNSMSNYTGYDLDPKLLALSEQTQQFKNLSTEIKSRIRLAKVNLQINKNSSQLLKNYTDMQQIKLSPKRKQKEGQRSKSNKKEKSSKSSPKLSKSKSKGKSKDKKENSQEKKRNHELNEISLFGKTGSSQEGAIEARLNRNQSEQMKKKQLQDSLQINSAKSQNFKKKQKKIKEDRSNLKIINHLSHGKIQNRDEYDEEEPSLPVFRARKRTSYQQGSYFSDGLTGNNKDNSLKKLNKGIHTNRQKRNESTEKQKIRNRSNSNCHQRHSNEEQEANKIHSEQISNLILKNKSHQKSGPIINDDEFLSKNSNANDTEPIMKQRSIQNDQSISATHFNTQNLTDVSQAQNFPQKSITKDQKTEDNEGHPQSISKASKKEEDQSTILHKYLKQHQIADYDQATSHQKQNDKIKQLQKIYLPRLQVKKPVKRKR